MGDEREICPGVFFTVNAKLSKMSQSFFNQNEKGVIPILILVAAIGVIAFVAGTSLLPFKDRLLGSIFPKKESSAATGYPTGFSEVQVASGLSNPTNMEYAPDGRLFINERGGQVKIFKNGAI